MANDSTPDGPHRQAFKHYLRMGQRLTNAEWLAAQEQKFNPYHDARGRFTSPPGMTVSWGKYGPASRAQDPAVARADNGHTAGAAKRQRRDLNDPAISGPTRRVINASELRSEFVRNAVVQAGHAETYFELNKRQADLERLRVAAGPNPAASIRADIDEIQRRFDADRARLDARQSLINPQTTELVRGELAPVSVQLLTNRFTIDRAPPS